MRVILRHILLLLFPPFSIGFFTPLRIQNAHCFAPINSQQVSDLNVQRCNKFIKSSTTLYSQKKYHLSHRYYEDYLHRLNSQNVTIQTNAILGNNNVFLNVNYTDNQSRSGQSSMDSLIDRATQIYNEMMTNYKIFDEDEKQEEDEYAFFKENDQSTKSIFEEFKEQYKPNFSGEETKSKNFEVIKNHKFSFANVGGYHNIKNELNQCVDILKNYQKYAKFNVRIPRGLIFEGPPGNGKTILARGLAGEARCGFISVSGSDFQEKYIGVGPTRIKELFKLAKKNAPCIIFIDEIDALGRKRSSDGESASNERDSTLNALLVEMDGFKNNTGVFIVGATNRIDLLDNALMRPGRIDKQIYIGVPDAPTREAIINIHINGKPNDDSVVVKDLVETTDGYSGAQIENLLNEAMLNALRENREIFNNADFDVGLNKMVAGWQPNEHEFTTDIIDYIAIHEMGHAVVGILTKHHSKLSKVIINLSSPKSPGYTVFEASTSSIYKRESLFEHLMILLAGRIAEEVFYDVSVTTGAINDFEEALKLAEKMVVYYGMGKNMIYPSLSEKYKELIDDDILNLINDAYKYTEIILLKSKDLIQEAAEILKKDKLLKADELINLIQEKYPHLLEMIIFE